MEEKINQLEKENKELIKNLYISKGFKKGVVTTLTIQGIIIAIVLFFILLLG